MAGPNPPPPDLDPTAWYVVVVGGADFETCKTNLKALMYRTLGNHEIRDVDECHISIDVERPYIRLERPRGKGGQGTVTHDAQDGRGHVLSSMHPLRPLHPLYRRVPEVRGRATPPARRLQARTRGGTVD